jgi:hypothetical protein
MPTVFGSGASEELGRRRQRLVSRGAEGLELTVRLVLGSVELDVSELTGKLAFGSVEPEASVLMARLVFGTVKSEASERWRRRARDSRERTFRLDELKTFGLKVPWALS